MRTSRRIGALVVSFLVGLAPMAAPRAAAKNDHKNDQKNDHDLPVKYEELTAPDFIKAVKKSAGTVIIPIGILEKHGPHLPLGTDFINARALAVAAAQKDYAVVFPEYYFGQVHEAKQQPGTIAYSHDVIWQLLQETCDELYRNGFTKIIIVNGHGGNVSWLSFFVQSQLEKNRGYALYYYLPEKDEQFDERVKEVRKADKAGHAGPDETSLMMIHRPDLVHLDRARSQDFADLARTSHLEDLYVGIGWYARFPNHYAGDGGLATPELSQMLFDHRRDDITKAIRAVKADKSVPYLQERYFEETEKPLRMKQ